MFLNLIDPFFIILNKCSLIIGKDSQTRGRHQITPMNMQITRMELIISMNILLMFPTLHQWQIIRMFMNHTKQKIALKLMIGIGINQCTVQLFNFHSQNKDSAWNQWGG